MHSAAHLAGAADDVGTALATILYGGNNHVFFFQLAVAEWGRSVKKKRSKNLK
jgi:hypothetical protein